MSDTPIFDQMQREAENNADDAHTLRRNTAVSCA